MNPQPGEVWLADLGLAAKTRQASLSSIETPWQMCRALVLFRRYGVSGNLERFLKKLYSGSSVLFRSRSIWGLMPDSALNPPTAWPVNAKDGADTSRRTISVVDCRPLSVRRSAPAIKGPSGVDHASTFARPLVADPQPRSPSKKENEESACHLNNA